MSSATAEFLNQEPTKLNTSNENGNLVVDEEDDDGRPEVDSDTEQEEEQEEDSEFEGLTAERIKVALAAMSSPAPQGILSRGNDHKSSKTHVTINAPPEQEKRQREVSPAPDPSKVTATPVNFAIKDEVELLRAGLMNTHGQHVKPQGK